MPVPGRAALEVFLLRHAQNMKATVNANNLTRGKGTGIRSQINRCAANRLKRRVLTQRRVHGGVLVGLSRPTDRSPRERFHRPG